LPTTDHTHDFEAFDRGVSRLHRLKSTGRAEDSFDATMICIDDVVQIFRSAMLHILTELTLSLQPMNGFRILAKLVNRVQWPASQRLQSSAQETIRSSFIPTIQQHEIYQFAMLAMTVSSQRSLLTIVAGRTQDFSYKPILQSFDWPLTCEHPVD
jgi:hypothetical protein